MAQRLARVEALGRRANGRGKGEQIGCHHHHRDSSSPLAATGCRWLGHHSDSARQRRKSLVPLLSTCLSVAADLQGAGRLPPAVEREGRCALCLREAAPEDYGHGLVATVPISVAEVVDPLTGNVTYVQKPVHLPLQPSSGGLQG